MSLKQHLLLVIGGAFAVLMLAMICGLVALRNSTAEFHHTMEHEIAYQLAITEMYANGLQASSSLRGVVLDPQNQAGYDNLKKGLADFETALKQAKTLPLLEGVGSDILPKIESMHERRKELIEKIGGMARTDNAAAIALLNKEEIPLWREIRKILLDTSKVVHKDTLQVEATTITEAQTAFYISLALSLAGLTMAAGSLFYILRKLDRSLGADPVRVADIAHKVTNGDLTHFIPHAPSQSVLAAMSEMQRRLSDTVRQIRTHSGSLVDAASSLAENEKSIVGNISTQSTEINDMAAAVEQLTVSIRQVADLGKETQGIASNSGQQAAASKVQIQRLITEMEEVTMHVRSASDVVEHLRQESTRIATVVQTIRDIADQTNLLALNAAIEAARAGEQGRGFAVVADEVRKLAERTSQSTADIGDTIARVQTGISDAVERMSASMQALDGSSTSVSAAGQTISLLEEASSQVVRTVEDIAHSIAEQSSVSTLIAQRIESISLAAGENTHTVGLEAQQTESVRQLAQQLDESVRFFRLSA